MPKSSNHSESHVDKVVAYIKREIAQGRLRPNQKISEIQISRWLGFSRSPIREALRLLERDGLIDLIPGRGAFIAEVTPEDACEIFSLRSCLMGLAVRQSAAVLTAKDLSRYEAQIDELKEAVKRSDTETFLRVTSAMERFFLDRCGSPRLERFMDMLGNPCLAYRSFLSSVPGYMKEVAETHANILQALKRGEASRAESLRRFITDRGGKLIYRYFLGGQEKTKRLVG